MPPLISKKSNIKLKVLGWYQIIGGVLGVLVTLWLITRVGQVNGLLIFVILFAICLYAFSIYTGRLLLTDNYRTGLKLSIINQAMQILQFAVLGYAFSYASGLMLTVGIKTSEGFTFTFNFGVISSWQISLATSSKEFSLAINLIAIYFLYFTEKLQTSIKREKEIFEEKQFAASNPAIYDQSISSPEQV